MMPQRTEPAPMLMARSVYQEFLAKTLTEKYATINTQMDKVIHNANTEISSLQTRLSGALQPSWLWVTY